MSDELIERVARAIYEAWNPSGVPWDSPIVKGNAFRGGKAMAQAAAAVRAVRQYDVDTGPTEAEVIAAWNADSTRTGLQAAAVERAREAGVE